MIPFNTIHTADCLDFMPQLPAASVHLIVADPPYFRVQLQQAWDNQWPDETEYLDWSLRWLREAMRLLVPGGLLYVFGQVGKREHVWLHLQSRACAEFAFHDLIIWDRAVGYNERRDSFTPAYEMILALRKDGAPPRFDKDAVREPYEAKTQALYLRDKRYKDPQARRAHLEKGKYATNVWRIASLKGASKEKLGHPTQKPLELIERLLLSSSRAGDLVFDPFCGSGTTLFAAQKYGRAYIGVEINAEFATLARRRLETYSNVLRCSK
ncbi:MAG: site-specific DNA-methyltransferase [Armatimonadetes bacterium]|nr:site-specific DNA-methyltransferase [Armatimonadota bacterium]